MISKTVDRLVAVSALSRRKALVDAIASTGRWELHSQQTTERAYKAWMTARRDVPIHWTDILHFVRKVDRNATYVPPAFTGDVESIRGRSFAIEANSSRQLYVVAYRNSVKGRSLADAPPTAK